MDLTVRAKRNPLHLGKTQHFLTAGKQVFQSHARRHFDPDRGVEVEIGDHAVSQRSGQGRFADASRPKQGEVMMAGCLGQVRPGLLLDPLPADQRLPGKRRKLRVEQVAVRPTASFGFMGHDLVEQARQAMSLTAAQGPFILMGRRV